MIGWFFSQGKFSMLFFLVETFRRNLLVMFCVIRLLCDKGFCGSPHARNYISHFQHKYRYYYQRHCKFLPLHSLPSSERTISSGHSQWYEPVPTSFTQMYLQPPLFSRHSSISENETRNKYQYDLNFLSFFKRL